MKGLKVLISILILLIVISSGCILDDENENSKEEDKKNLSQLWEYSLEVKINIIDDYKIIVPFLYPKELNFLNNITTNPNSVQVNVTSCDEIVNLSNGYQFGLECIFNKDFTLNFTTEKWCLMSLRKSEKLDNEKYWIYLDSKNNNSIEIKISGFTPHSSEYVTEPSFQTIKNGWNIINIKYITWDS